MGGGGALGSLIFRGAGSGERGAGSGERTDATLLDALPQLPTACPPFRLGSVVWCGVPPGERGGGERYRLGRVVLGRVPPGWMWGVVGYRHTGCAFLSPLR